MTEPAAAGPPSRPLGGVTVVGRSYDPGLDGRHAPATQWIAWERSGRVAPAPLGWDLWERPEPALDRAAATGAAVCALSVEWARVEPAAGVVDAAAMDRYAAILAMCAERGMAPVVALYDLTHPSWMGEELWLMPGAPDRFADHVARVVSRLGEGCRRWITLRRANAVALGGWIAGRQPPGRMGALSDAWAVVDNLLAGHVLAYRAVHELQPGADVAIGARVSPCYDWHRLLVDLLCCRSLGVERGALDAWTDERRALHDVAVPPGGVAPLLGRRLLAALCPYGTGAAAPVGVVTAALRRRSPRRVVELVYDVDGGRPVDSLLAGWEPPIGTGRGGTLAMWPPRPVRRRRTEPASYAPGSRAGSLAQWCRDQAAFTPALPVWVEVLPGPGTGPPAAPCAPDDVTECSGVLVPLGAAGGRPAPG